MLHNMNHRHLYKQAGLGLLCAMNCCALPAKFSAAVETQMVQLQKRKEFFSQSLLFKYWISIYMDSVLE